MSLEHRTQVGYLSENIINKISGINIKPNIPTTQSSPKSSTPTSGPNTPTQTAFGVKILVIDLVLIVASFLISYFAVYAL
ncbi:hypothetical protein G9A89_008483 [Geosiphon pyriformis]|nr:hypothetical protein G9A89_008483 [Geosiphon pyriformis]